MHIAVVLRLMPSLGDELEVDDTGVDIDREIVEMVINEFDEQRSRRPCSSRRRRERP